MKLPQKAEEQCVVCQDVITNPICMDCLQKEIEHWLIEKKPTLIPLLRSARETFKGYTHDVVNCIICGKNMNVCAHCYSKEVQEWLKQDFPELAEEFGYLFNYDLEGYTVYT